MRTHRRLEDFLSFMETAAQDMQLVDMESAFEDFSFAEDQSYYEDQTDDWNAQ